MMRSFASTCQAGTPADTRAESARNPRTSPGTAATAATAPAATSAVRASLRTVPRRRAIHANRAVTAPATAGASHVATSRSSSATTPTAGASANAAPAAAEDDRRHGGCDIRS